MNYKVFLGALVLLMPILVWAKDATNTKDVFITENAINIPVGRILLAKFNKKKGYCAVQFTSSQWNHDEGYAKYVTYYIPDSTIRFTDPKIKPYKDEVYQKQPLSIIGRFAIARFQDGIFCGEITLTWSAGPTGTANVYFDEDKKLRLAPTQWQDIRNVNVTDPKLKWYKYGDVKSQSN